MKIIEYPTKTTEVFKDGRYVCEISPNTCNVVDTQDNYKPIKERTVYFDTYHRGSKQRALYNGMPMYIRESELHTVEKHFKDCVQKIKDYRRERLTKEREARKKYPIKHTFVFKNVTITAIEKLCYYNQGYQTDKGWYSTSNERIILFYANGRPYRSKGVLSEKDVLDLNYVIEQTITNTVQHNYDKEDFTDRYVQEFKTILDYRYIPVQYLIGYQFKYKKQTYDIINMWSLDKKLRGRNDEIINIPLSDFMQKAVPLGEVSDIMDRLIILRNVAKFY